MKKSLLPIILFSLISICSVAQNSKILVKVFDKDNNEPLGYAVVALLPVQSYGSTDEEGNYCFEKVEAGKVTLKVDYVGMVSVDTTFTVIAGRNYNMYFEMRMETFQLESVTVVATASKAGKSTASKISRQAMDHIQTGSLKDVMALMPGVSIENPNLSQAQSINIRTLSTGGINSLGTAIIVDGSPVSNNANLQALSPTISGSTSAGEYVAASASPSSGVDIRNISTDNIESIEVIRGIPSVEYGDMTSGAVIVKSKAGVTPLVLRFKTNPNIYQASVSKGFSLGKKGGELNINGDYAYSTSSIIKSYEYYQRFNVKALWSKTFASRFNTNTSLELIYGKDTRDVNPDDLSLKTASGANDLGVRFNSTGSISINAGWFKSINYTISGTYTDKKSYYETLATNAMNLYATGMQDGSVYTNIKNFKLVDADGNVVTKYMPGDEDAVGTILPYSYFTHYDIFGKEVNAFAKLTAHFHKNWGEDISNHIAFGADFKTDGNLGKGVVFDDDTPPYRSISNADSGFRRRKFSDIPFINQVGIYLQDSYTHTFGKRTMNIEAGVRYDLINGKSSIAPRINASFDIVPEILTIRGGWGITSKAPTAIYLYPQPAYYDQVWFNNINPTVPVAEQFLVAATRVFDATNPNLEIARNRKAEIGLDLTIENRYRFSVTAYDEKMDNGYILGYDLDTWKWVEYPQYKVVSQAAGSIPTIALDQVYHLFFSYAKPMNNLVTRNRGIEYELDLGRFKEIRTSFYLNGAWMQSSSSNKGYSFSSNPSGDVERNIAVYEPYLRTSKAERLITTLRATHNIPNIGFVVTLTAQVNWYEKYGTEYGNDEMFIKYISRKDGQVYDFDPALKDDKEFKYMFTTRSSTRGIFELTFPTLMLNLNLTKEIGDLVTASFYVNNILNSRPLYNSKMNPGEFSELGIPIFFGFEVKMTIK